MSTNWLRIGTGRGRETGLGAFSIASRWKSRPDVHVPTDAPRSGRVFDQRSMETAPRRSAAHDERSVSRGRSGRIRPCSTGARGRRLVSRRGCSTRPIGRTSSPTRSSRASPSDRRAHSARVVEVGDHVGIARRPDRSSRRCPHRGRTARSPRCRAWRSAASSDRPGRFQVVHPVVEERVVGRRRRRRRTGPPRCRDRRSCGRSGQVRRAARGERGQEVDRRDDLVADAAGRDPRRPANDAGHTLAALPRLALGAAQRRVAPAVQVRPSPPTGTGSLPSEPLSLVKITIVLSSSPSDRSSCSSTDVAQSIDSTAAPYAPLSDWSAKRCCT